MVYVFSRWLQQQSSARYARPVPLDVQGPGQSAQRQPDFLLRGIGCPNVVVELKRLMTCDISTEKEAERRIRAAAREALGLGKRPLPQGYTLVLRSSRTCVPVGGRWRDQFVRRLRKAFKESTPDKPYKSRSRPPFELWRMPSNTQPFAVDATMLRDGFREFVRLLKNADAKRDVERRLRSGGTYVLLFLVAGPGAPTYNETEFWMLHERLRTGWGPRRDTHVYSLEARDDTAPRIIVSGLWPESNGVCEDIPISHMQASQFSAYAFDAPRAESQG
jgi:hypothetical protein